MPDAPHVASLTILAGPLKGHALTVEDAVDDLLVGSDPDCRFVVSLPGVSAIHARLWIDPTGATVYNTRGSRGIFVNDSPVGDQAPLRDGDILWLGPPGEPDSVMIQFRHRKAAAWAAAASPKGGREVAASLEPATTAGDDWLIEELEASVGSLGAAAHAPAPPPAEPQPIVAPEPPVKPEPVVDGEPLVEVQPEPATVDDGFIVDEAEEAPAEVLPPPVSDENEGFFVEEAPPAPAPVAASEAIDEWAVSDDVPASPQAVPDEVESDTFVVDEPAAASAIEEDVFVTDEEAIVFAAPPPPQPARQPTPPTPVPEVRQPTPPTPVPEARQPTPPTPVPEAARPVRTRPPSGRPAARPAPRAAGGGNAVKWIAIAGGTALVLVGGGLAALRFLGGPRLEGVEPNRARVGDQLVLRGRGFSPQAARNVVHFDGAQEARVLAASAERLQVEVPEIALPPGGSKQVPITVAVEGGETEPVEVTLFQAPRCTASRPAWPCRARRWSWPGRAGARP